MPRNSPVCVPRKVRRTATRPPAPKFAEREGMTPARVHLLWELGAAQPHQLADRLVESVT